MPRNRRSWLYRYGMALVVTGIALVITLLMRPLTYRVPFLIFYVATTVSAAYGGFGPGTLSAILTVILVDYFLFNPFHTFSDDPIDLLAVGLFIGTTAIVNWVYAARQRAEQKLYEQREQFRATLASIGDAVIATDAGGQVTFMNPVAESLTGWAQQEALGRNSQEVFHIVNETTHHPAGDPVQQALHAGTVVSLANQTALMAKDGREIPIDDSAAPIRGEDGALHGTILVFRDVTEGKRAEAERTRLYAEIRAHADLLEQKVRERTAELQAALNRVEAADHAKSVMLANVTHEMRTPLSSIVGFSYLMLHRELDYEKNREFARIIYGEGHRLMALVDNFLDLQHIITDRQVFHFVTFDLAALIRSVVNAYPLGKDSPHSITLQLEPAPVYADQEYLRRVLLNLLSNAVKYSPNGGAIRLALLRQGNEVVFSIADSGVGIPPDELAQLFERFQRGSKAEHLRIQGTGLGLALSQAIIGAHGGRIWAESAGADQGATFLFALPVVNVVDEVSPPAGIG